MLITDKPNVFCEVSVESTEHNLNFQSLLIQQIKANHIKWELPEKDRIGKRFLLSNSVSSCFTVGRESENLIFLGGMGKFAESIFYCDFKVVLESNQFLIRVNVDDDIYSLRLQVQQEYVDALIGYINNQARMQGLPADEADVSIPFKNLQSHGVSYDFRVTDTRTVPLIQIH